MLLLVILVPLLVAGATSFLLVRREAAATATTGVKHQPRAAGFGRGGMPVPVQPPDSGLASLLQPPLRPRWWVRTLRLLLLAVLLTVAAAVVAGGIYEIGRWAGQAFKRFATGG